MDLGSNRGLQYLESGAGQAHRGSAILRIGEPGLDAMENEEFGRIFVMEVRDNAIATIDDWVTRNSTVSQERPTAIADLQRILPDLVQCTIEVSADFLTSDSHDFMQLDPTETVWTSAKAAPTLSTLLLDVGRPVIDGRSAHLATVGPDKPLGRFFRHLGELNQSDAISLFIPFVVDDVLAGLAAWMEVPYLRFAFESGPKSYCFPSKDGSETHAWYLRKGGWRDKFTSARYHTFSRTSWEFVDNAS